MLLRILSCLALSPVFLSAAVYGQDEPAPAPAAEQPAAKAPNADPGLKSDKQKASYTIGVNIGNSLKRDNIEVDMQALARGLADAVSGKKPALSETEMRQAMMALQKELRARQEAEMKERVAKMKALAAENQKKAQAFLAANKAKAGIKTTPSGLQYQVVKEGEGPTPKATDTVKVHYRGTLVDGSEFDSSYKRGEPAKFPVNRVIKGWVEALQLMKVGGKWRLYVPPKLGYGEFGSGPKIGPNEVLIFDVELLGIE